jgi:hypothetical protein
MFQTASRHLLEILLILVTAVATHLVMYICADADALQACELLAKCQKRTIKPLVS